MTASLEEILTFAARLEAAGLAYSLTIVRPEALMFEVAVPGERWEVEFTRDGEVEVEVFTSTGVREGRELVERLFAES